ncbi:MAG: hypothetical protein QOG04_2084 [Actinomycetota bacterium]|jgi:hypothetical protein|nr:hypothetical protein [Actinomycetota bacterium]
MRKLIALASASLILGSLIGGVADAAPKQQSVEGTIVAPARHPDGCYTGLQRHATSVAGEAINGVVGWTIKIDKATWNKPFKLDGVAPAGTVDLDITYYLGEFATQAEFANDPAPVAPASIAFETRGQTGESGIVPKYAINALVCVYADEAAPAVSGAVDFSYLAGKGVK